jgi:hypothetical protein
MFGDHLLVSNKANGNDTTNRSAKSNRPRYYKVGAFLFQSANFTAPFPILLSEGTDGADFRQFLSSGM